MIGEAIGFVLCLAAVVWFIRYTDRLARTRHSSPL
jgi:hypothetical protein